MTAKKKIDLAPTVRIAPGYVVVNVSTAAGGVSYDRIVLAENPEGEAVVTDYQTRKTVDHVELVKAIDHTVKDVDHALRILCVRTPFGHFVSMDKVETVRTKVAEIAARVSELNEAAEAAGSAHRGRVGVVTALLDIANPDNLRECHRVIRETLMEIHAALRRGDVRDEKNEEGDITRRHQLRPILIRARNLEQMALGLHGTTIKSALERAKAAKTEILAQIDAGVKPEDAGAAIMLGEIETAIAWFEDED